MSESALQASQCIPVTLDPALDVCVSSPAQFATSSPFSSTVRYIRVHSATQFATSESLLQRSLLHPSRFPIGASPPIRVAAPIRVFSHVLVTSLIRVSILCRLHRRIRLPSPARVPSRVRVTSPVRPVSFIRVGVAGLHLRGMGDTGLHPRRGRGYASIFYTHNTHTQHTHKTQHKHTHTHR